MSYFLQDEITLHGFSLTLQHRKFYIYTSKIIHLNYFTCAYTHDTNDYLWKSMALNITSLNNYIYIGRKDEPTNLNFTRCPNTMSHCLFSKMKDFASLCFFKRTIILNYGIWQGKKIIILNCDRRQWLLTLDEISPIWGTFRNDLIFPQNPLGLGSWNIPTQSGRVQVGPGLITQHTKRQMKSTSGKFYQPPLSRRRRPFGCSKIIALIEVMKPWVVPQSSLNVFRV